MNSIFAKVKCGQEKCSTFWLSKLITITILFVPRDAHAQAYTQLSARAQFIARAKS